ncbi:hypothetical protein Pint_18990 [Pistacia integerrima]|uniref:Uncharacterized protein n=1 Tax=Pistacia integerrima TaxID=434235 RepID=A0ACC0YX74_9ROSI|nr:hypothetical protein Pint_18990 [Pistacia integerrima]
MGEAKEEAVRTIIEFVKAPDMFQRLDIYLEFQTANSTLLKSYGLVHEDCITKMRLMSLVDLGSSGSGQIPYALIRDTLRISEDEVEMWVVKAITAKLNIRCTERVFSPAPVANS